MYNAEFNKKKLAEISCEGSDDTASESTQASLSNEWTKKVYFDEQVRLVSATVGFGSALLTG